MEFRLLGVLDVLTPGGAQRVPGGQRRALLARLLLDAGTPVDLDEVVAAIWVATPPPTHRHAVHARVHEVRRLFDRLDPDAGASIERAGSGYLLRLGTATTDVQTFRSAVRRGRLHLEAGAVTAAEEQWRAALACWRGAPLADVTSLRDGEHAVALRQERAATARDWAWSALTTGRTDGVPPVLAAVLREDPLSEPLTALQMVALARTGRRAAALAEFRRLATDLRQELGVGPPAWTVQLRDSIDAGADDLLDGLGPHLRLPAAGSGTARGDVAGSAGAAPAGAAPDGAEPPLLGRDDERTVLGQLLARTRQRVLPHLVTVLGEPGIGKTRLLDALLRDAADTGIHALVVRGREGDRVDPLRPLGALLAARATGVGGGGPVGEQVAQACPDEARSLLPVLLRTVGPGPDDAPPAPAPGVLTEALCRYLFPAGAPPAVLVLDDLHHAADVVLDVVERVTEAAEGRAVLVVVAARPELLLRRPSWSGGRPDSTIVSLPPLGPEDSAALLHDLLGPGAADAAPALRVAGGNPLLITEIARARARGVDAQLATASMAAVLAASLDAAEPRDRVVLDVVAVVGPSATAGSVAALTGLPAAGADAALDRLRTLRLLRRATPEEVGDEGEPAFTFRHDLLREATSAQIGPSSRHTVHVRAARFFAARAADAGGRVPVAPAARHFVHALASHPGGTPRWWPEAARAVLAATSGTAWTYFVDEALSWLRAVADSGSVEHPELAPVLHRLGGHMIVVGQDGRPLVERARTLHREAGAAVPAALTEYVLAYFDLYHGAAARAAARLDAATSELRGAPPTAEFARMLRLRATIHDADGRLTEAETCMDEAVAVAERAEGGYELAMCRSLAAALRAVRGVAGALEEVEHLLEALESMGEHRLVQWVNLVEASVRAGDLARARSAWDRMAPRIARDPSPVARTEAHLQDRRLRFWAGDPAPVEADPDAAPLPQSARWQVALLAAESALVRRDGPAALRAAQEALAVAGPRERGRSRIAALACRAAAARLTGASDHDRFAADVAGEYRGLVPHLAAVHVANALAAAGWRASDLSDAPATPWRSAAAAVLDGDLHRAARAYEDLGALPDALVCWEAAAAGGGDPAAGPVDRVRLLRRRLLTGPDGADARGAAPGR